MDNVSIFEELYEDFKITKPVRLIELFAGIGSQAKALERLNVDFEHYKVCEFDKYAMDSYNAIHGTNFETSDITKLHAKDLNIVLPYIYIYILTYSFPCQDLSVAGNMRGMKKGEKTRSGLLWEVERILDECENLPQILLMENVPQVINDKNIKDFNLWTKKIESLGYSNYINILNSKDYGIPQNRNRCFMVSILGKYNYTFPKGFKLNKNFYDLLEEKVDDKYFLTEKMVECFTKYKSEKYNRKYNFNKNFLHTKDLAFTLTTRINGRDTDNYLYDKRKNGEIDIRGITPLEAFRLMGFDDEDYQKCKDIGMSDTQLFKQAGNSIVVDVLYHIFKQFYKFDV
jgi:DNA (cytosine-5)-methyltransferase 1